MYAVLEHALGGLGIGHEVRGQVALVELHALDIIQGGVGGLAVLDLHHALGPDLADRLGDNLAHLGVVVGGDGGHLAVVILALALDRHRVDGLGRGLRRLVHAPLQHHRVRARRHVTQTLGKDRLGEHGRRGGAVAGLVGRLLSHLVHHFGAHGLERLGERHFLGDADAVLGDVRSPVGLLDHHVTPRGPHRALDRLGQPIDPALHLKERGIVEHDLFRGH